ncbi:MAG: hypothetical protein KDC38_01800 [Planctomycetes bacterium]|nr:hypothetical protein [Planctomycetota bacterium]
MSDLPAGPYKVITTPEGLRVPYYIIPFDKRGICEGPATRAALLSDLDAGDYSHVILFSHGWNNDWTVATQRYQDFIEGFMKMRQQHALAPPADYRPLLIGIFWPSTALVFGEDEWGPGIAGAEGTDARVGEELSAIRDLAGALSPDDARRFFELVQQPEVRDGEIRELARLAAKLTDVTDDEIGDGDAPTELDILHAWSSWASMETPDLDEFGTLNGAPDGDGPEAAGWFDWVKKLDPRPLVRTLTVYRMKDRAGTVGSHGVGPLLREVLSHSRARVHLVGHSFGGKIVLSATCYGGELPRPVESMLLLQPAVSHLCFAGQVPKRHHPGGYRSALQRVRQPILSTFSKHDAPLTQFFHLALRRERDLGEVEIAGGSLSPYAALGGFGPRAAGERLIPIALPTQRYELTDGVEVFGLQGDAVIGGHGDISNPATWWTLYQQMER